MRLHATRENGAGRVAVRWMGWARWRHSGPRRAARFVHFTGQIHHKIGFSWSFRPSRRKPKCMCSPRAGGPGGNGQIGRTRRQEQILRAEPTKSCRRPLFRTGPNLDHFTSLDGKLSLFLFLRSCARTSMTFERAQLNQSFLRGPAASLVTA